ncbi:beta-galactosidase trimerization domain-containing protein [Dysgonomonas sp. 520]|uniref:beta-galactosidase trimerization domain-containing protein n=1 Tax=Dysgonomonas sp. 520 TaxID=2302931 RepID=UPI003519F5B3
MKTDGTSVSTSGEEYIQAVKEIKELRKLYDPKASIPKDYAARKTGILYNPDNRWEMEYQPQTNQWRFMGHIYKYYRILQSFVAPVDIIDETHDFSAYPVLIAPAYQLLDKDLIARWKKYVENGGHLVLTCRTGQKDREAHLWKEKFAEPVYELIGAKELFFDVLPETRIAHVRMLGFTYDWNNWADVVDPLPNTEVWGVYDDQFYKGKSAVTRTKHGKGTVTFVGADTDNSALEKAAMTEVYKRAGISVENLPNGIVKVWRHGFWIVLNYSSDNYEADIPADAKIIIGEKVLKPAGVVVWR